jgi:hypothetical protein
MFFTPNLTVDEVLALKAMAAAEKKKAPPDTNCPATLPRLSASTYAMNSTVNCCALFGTLRSVQRLEYVKKVFDATNGGRVTYKGPELRQDDKAVLLELIHQRRNMFAGEVEFAPSTFCSRMGWSRNSEGSARLRKCLERLTEATLRLDKTTTSGAMFHLLSDFKWDGDRWTAILHDEVTNLFPTRHFAYLNIDARRELTTGLQTWLYDYISSNDCKMVMTYASLREACGRPDENPKQFVDYVKAALTRLIAVGAIVKFELAKCPHSKKLGALVTKKHGKQLKATIA